ncbi:MAG: NTP transferase domain-containing protein [bacterium]|nr:NTP transferase domain-containing protein [bacterium]
MIGGIVMAAGMSERMDGPLPKQLLPFSGRPLVAVAAANAAASMLDEVVIVTGHRGTEVAAAVAGVGVAVVNNPEFANGNMTSLRAGHAAIPDCDAYVLLLADIPGVTTAMIDAMVAAWNAFHPWAAVAEYRKERRHPLLLSAAAMGSVLSATEPRAVWNLLEAASVGEVLAVHFGSDAPDDINTAADYEALTGNGLGRC